MTDYEALAGQEILAQLRYTPDEIDLIGRVLSLAEDTALVRFVELRPTNVSHFHQPVLELHTPRETSLRVVLQPSAYDLSHDLLDHKIEEALTQRGIPAADLFTYCARSYGLELGNVDIHLGGMPMRTDKKCHPNDQIQLQPSLIQ